MARLLMVGYEMINRTITYCINRGAWLILVTLIGFITEAYAVDPSPTTFTACRSDSNVATNLRIHSTGHTTQQQACTALDLTASTQANFYSNIVQPSQRCGVSGNTSTNRIQAFNCLNANNSHPSQRPIAIRQFVCPANSALDTPQTSCVCNSGYTDTGTACTLQQCTPQQFRNPATGLCETRPTCPNEFHTFDPTFSTSECRFNGCNLQLYYYTQMSRNSRIPTCRVRRQCAPDAVYNPALFADEPESCVCQRPKVHNDLTNTCENPPPPPPPPPPPAGSGNGNGTSPPSGSNTNPPLGGSGFGNPPTNGTYTPPINTGGSGTTQANGNQPLPDGGGGQSPADGPVDPNNPNENDIQFDSIPLGGNVGQMDIGGSFNINPFGGAGFCPTMNSFTVAGRTFTLNIQPMCDLAAAMKVVVILVSSIIGAFIVSGRTQ